MKPERYAKDVVIFDGKGYWVGMRRPRGKIVHIWSPKLKDAARFHFYEVALRVANEIPQPVQFLSI
jgi:hypothetical protein